METQQAQAQLQHAQQQLQQQQQQLLGTQQQNEQLRQRIAQLEAAAAAAAAARASGPAPDPQHSAAAHSSRIKAMAPSAFVGGVGVNPEQWLREMERYLRVTGVDPASWVPLSSTYLKGGASVWLNTLDSATQDGDWHTFRDAFLARFSPLDAARVARAALRKLRQRRNVAEYSTAFLRQIELIPDMSMADQLEYYLSGLHARLADAVDRQHPATLQEAMNAAQREELRQVTRQSYGPSGMRPHYYQPRPTYSGPSYAGGESMDLSVLEQEIDSLYAADTLPSFSSGEEHLYALPMRRLGGTSNFRGPRDSFQEVSSARPGWRGVPGLTRDEFDRLSRENRCFSCRQPGHLARNCTRNQRRSDGPRYPNPSSSTNSSK